MEKPVLSNPEQISSSTSRLQFSKNPLILLGLLLILLSGLIGFLLGKYSSQPKPIACPAPQPSPTVVDQKANCQIDSDCVLVTNNKECCPCPFAINKDELNKNKDLIKFPKITLEVIPTPPGCEDVECMLCVVGFLKAACLDKRCTSIEQITPTPFPDLTARWKTYTNSFAKFYLKYPQDGKYTEKSFNEKENQVIISGNFGSLTINMAVVNYGPGWGGGCDQKDHGFISILGQTKEVCINETGFHELYLENPGVAQLNFGADFALPYETNKEVVSQILSTFKFLE